MRTILTAVLAMLAGAGPAVKINGSAAGRIAPGWPVELHAAGGASAPGGAKIEVRDERQREVPLDWRQVGSASLWVLEPGATEKLTPGRYQVSLTADGKRASAPLEVMQLPFEADDHYLADQVQAYTRYERATGQTELAARREALWRASRSQPGRHSSCER